jgi:hypothetical protein
MIARGDAPRVARRLPLGHKPNEREALKERDNYDGISHFQCSPQLIWLTRGDALRVAQRLPLAFIFRAFGAVHTILQ